VSKVVTNDTDRPKPLSFLTTFRPAARKVN
jgi:hypothetical protein